MRQSSCLQNQLLLNLDKLERRGDFEELSNLYFQFCSKITNPAKSKVEYDNFCNNLQEYFGDNTQPNENTANLIEYIRNTAEKHEKVGLETENDHLFEAHITSVSVRDFYHQKLLMFESDSQIPIKEWIQQPDYTSGSLSLCPLVYQYLVGLPKCVLRQNSLPSHI